MIAQKVPSKWRNSTEWTRESKINVLNACRNGVRKCDIAKSLGVSVHVVDYLYQKGLSIERREWIKKRQQERDIRMDAELNNFSDLENSNADT